MEKKFTTYQMSSVRIWDGEQEYTIPKGYKLVIPSYGPAGPFVTMQRDSSRVHEKTYMMRVIEAQYYGNKLNKDVYERDIVTYRKDTFDQLFMGVVIYRKDMYMWGILCIENNDFTPLYQCQVTEVLGSIYTTPELLSDDPQTQSEFRAVLDLISSKEKGSEENPLCDLEKEDMQQEDTYAYIDEPVPGLDGAPVRRKKEPLNVAATVPAHPEAMMSMDELPNTNTEEKNDKGSVVTPITDVFVDFDISDIGTTVCNYKLKCGDNEKDGSHVFTKLGATDNYYITTGTIIALSKLRNPKSVVIHTKYNDFNSAINAGMLQQWEANGWRKSDNTPLLLGKELSLLKVEVDRLLSMNCSVSAEMQAS